MQGRAVCLEDKNCQTRHGPNKKGAAFAGLRPLRLHSWDQDHGDKKAMGSRPQDGHAQLSEQLQGQAITEVSTACRAHATEALAGCMVIFQSNACAWQFSKVKLARHVAISRAFPGLRDRRPIGVKKGLVERLLLLLLTTTATIH